MTSILYHFDAPPALRSRLAPMLDGLDVHWCAEDDEDKFARVLADTDVLWHVLRPITTADMDGAPKLRLIQKLGVGLNTIDLDAARQRGIAVANMPGANAAAVTESTVTLMLASLRRIIELDRRTRAGTGWPIDTELAGTVGELAQATVGLVGYGNVARHVERVLRAFGSTVLHTAHQLDGSESCRTLDELAAESDIISLHLPLTEATRGMIGAAQLARMPTGAILVNTSRGETVDEGALVAALRSGRLAAAALDVFAHELVAADNPLLKLETVIFQPHVAWLTSGTMARCTAIAAENTRRFARGQELENRVV